MKHVYSCPCADDMGSLEVCVTSVCVIVCISTILCIVCVCLHVGSIPEGLQWIILLHWTKLWDRKGGSKGSGNNVEGGRENCEKS